MKIKELSNDGLKPIYRTLAQMVGITEPPTDEITEMTSKLLKSRFAHLDVSHINEAGELYASGKISGFEHFNKFSPAFIGRMMHAMQEILLSDGRLMNNYDRERHPQENKMIIEPGDLPIEYEKDGSFNWGHYLNDLFQKFKNGKLAIITTFIPVNCYPWMVFKGHLKADSWLLYSQKASEVLSKKRRPYRVEFQSMESLAITVGNHEHEAKKLAVLEYLVKKINAK
jgi:hypothetical protein